MVATMEARMVAPLVAAEAVAAMGMVVLAGATRAVADLA